MAPVPAAELAILSHPGRTDPPAAQRAVIPPRYGNLDWPTPGLNPTGRSGNHAPEGFLVAAGDGIRSAG